MRNMHGVAALYAYILSRYGVPMNLGHAAARRISYYTRLSGQTRFRLSHGPLTEATATLARAYPPPPQPPHLETRQNLFCASAKLKTLPHHPLAS